MEFIKTELLEARVFRGKGDFKGNPQKFADITYQHFLAFNIMKHETPSIAADYAKKVMQFPTFDTLRNSQTDFGNLIAAMNNPEKYLNSDKKKYNMPELQLRRWFREAASAEIDILWDRRLFLQLEEGLKQNSPVIKQIRRIITDWPLTDPDHFTAGSRLYRMLYNTSYNGDMIIKFMELCRHRGWSN